MTTVLLDSHVVHWWADEPERMSAEATRAVSEADELAIAAISWPGFEPNYWPTTVHMAGTIRY